jgi:hypothetical protein
VYSRPAYNCLQYQRVTSCGGGLKIRRPYKDFPTGAAGGKSMELWLKLASGDLPAPKDNNTALYGVAARDLAMFLTL